MDKIDFIRDNIDLELMGHANPDDDILKLVAQGVEAELETQGWDRRPSFYFLIWLPAGEGYLPNEDEGAFGAMEAGLPEVWYNDPAVVTPYILRGAREIPAVRAKMKELVPQEYAGIMVSFEGWTVPEPEDPNGIEWSIWDEARKTRGFQTHPDRVEERCLWVFATGGQEIAIFRKRGMFPETFIPGEEGVLAGRMPADMRALRDEFWEILRED